jgi:hypothetical protein
MFPSLFINRDAVGFKTKKFGLPAFEAGKAALPTKEEDEAALLPPA